jgi:hypothetical protein
MTDISDSFDRTSLRPDQNFAETVGVNKLVTTTVPARKRVNLTAFCRMGMPPLEPFSRGGFSYGWNGWLAIRVQAPSQCP